MAEEKKPDTELTETPENENEAKEAQERSVDHKLIPSKDIWPSLFGKLKKITWQDFVAVCQRKSHEGLIFKDGEKLLLNADQNKINGLKILLEPKEKGEITRLDFDTLMKWFDPLMVYSPYVNEDETGNGWSLERISRLAEEEWFYGWLPQAVAHEHLQGDPPGTFLFRFSSSTVGGYALDVVDNHGKPASWRVKPQGPFNTFVIPGSGYNKPYKGLESIIQIHKKELIGKSQVTLSQGVPRDKFACLNEDQEQLHDWLESVKLRELYPLLKQKGLTMNGLDEFQSVIDGLAISDDYRQRLRKAITKHLEKPLRPKPTRSASRRRRYKILI